jgi:hypothetical protein
MIAALVAVRDFFLALALAWIGVTLEREATREPGGPAPAACTSVDGKGCTFSRPSFDAFGCPDA